MTLDLNAPHVRFAADAVRRAGLLSREIQEEMAVKKITKSDASPVTVADFACQAVIAKALVEYDPAAVLVGEENAGQLRDDDNAAVVEVLLEYINRSEPRPADRDTVFGWIDFGAGVASKRYWTLDPIDGTKGYLRGQQYATALALIEDGRPVFAALACPNLSADCTKEANGEGALVLAERGKGTWSAPIAGGDFKRLQVSARTNPADARMLRSFVPAHTNADAMTDLANALGATAEPVLMDSQAKYAVLAAGAGELLLRLLSPKQPDYKECIWDQAAGALVTEEAGGMVTDLHGNALDFSHGRHLVKNIGVCASNGHLHEACLAALKQLN